MFSLLLLVSLCSGRGVLASAPAPAAVEAVEAAYLAVVGVVSPGQTHLTGDSLRSLFNTLGNRVQCGGEVPCGKCDLAGAVHQLIGNHSDHGLEESVKIGDNVTVSVSQFSPLASGSVLYLSSPGPVCVALSQGKWAEETEHFLHKFTHHDHVRESHDDHGHNHMDVHGLESVLRELHHHYKPSDNQSCVTASSIMKEVDPTSADQIQEVGAVLGRVLYHALLGHCFSPALPEKSFFLDYIMHHLGSENVTVKELEVLMSSLKIGPAHDHDDGHGHEHGHSHEEDGHDGHDDRRLRRRKRSIHERHEGHESNNTWEHHCFSADELVLIYGVSDSSNSTLGRSELGQLSPALVQQILSGACAETPEEVAQDGLTRTERYLYATLANVVITLAAMFGIVVLLCTSCTQVFQMSIQFCVSMAVGSLTGDALLHLLPMFLGLHVHVPGSSHSHDHDEGLPDYLLKMLATIGGIYFFYLMEAIFSLITHKNKHHHHQHHHGEESDPHHCDHGRVLEMYQQEEKQKKKIKSSSKADLVDSDDKENTLSEMNASKRELRLLPYMITIGDGIHNFADGLAIGAAFSLSWRSGLSTSLAVLCHELPHELGDFAILLHSGMSVCKALLLNVGSALTSFIGLYIALSVATDIATQQWIAAVAGGLFLYVGLADMLPTLIHVNSKRPWLMFALQNLGLLTGWSALLLLSIYEEQISF
ncbi:zinc transporter ZIP4 [Cololabis saira]|uniref:zinc transporter ZIP4 n=1 Tax=Cololabis saira TaxID=129043 RepID=UPI002AD513D1|nr:zinc transporter ZIP4 [Cololabis saira]